jgi:hypothetical protein
VLSSSQLAAHASSIHIIMLNERVQLLEGMTEDAKRSAADAKRSLAATKRAAATQVQEAQAQAAAQAGALQERLLRLSEQKDQLEQDKALFIDAHAVLKARLGAAEDEKRQVQEELAASQDTGSAMCAEVDRLRASVEEMTIQSATSSGDGVAHATVGSGLRRANSALEGERTHLSMETTVSNASSNGSGGSGSYGGGGSGGVDEDGAQAQAAREHRRSFVAASLRPGF